MSFLFYQMQFPPPCNTLLSHASISCTNLFFLTRVSRLMPKQTVIMSKKSLQFTPLGPFMTMAGTIFIDRGNSAQARKSVDDAIERMKKERTSLWMFPEGTRHMSKQASMLPLKKGGFHMAIKAGIPIIPIVTQNYWNIYRKGIFNSGVITVRGMRFYLYEYCIFTCELLIPIFNSVYSSACDPHDGFSHRGCLLSHYTRARCHARVLGRS